MSIVESFMISCRKRFTRPPLCLIPAASESGENSMTFRQDHRDLEDFKTMDGSETGIKAYFVWFSVIAI
jgi:hypothetical protein